MLRCESRRFGLHESLYHTSKTPNNPATPKKVTYFVAAYPPIAVFWQELPENGYFLLYSDGKSVSGDITVTIYKYWFIEAASGKRR